MANLSIRNSGDDRDRVRVSPTQDTNCTRVSETWQQSFTCDATNDAIDSTPPSKRAKFYFHRCFDATFNPNKISGAEKVLAPDSDDDNDAGGK